MTGNSVKLGIAAVSILYDVMLMVRSAMDKHCWREGWQQYSGWSLLLLCFRRSNITSSIRKGMLRCCRSREQASSRYQQMIGIACLCLSSVGRVRLAQTCNPRRNGRSMLLLERNR